MQSLQVQAGDALKLILQFLKEHNLVKTMKVNVSPKCLLLTSRFICRPRHQTLEEESNVTLTSLTQTRTRTLTPPYPA